MQLELRDLLVHRDVVHDLHVDDAVPGVDLWEEAPLSPLLSAKPAMPSAVYCRPSALYAYCSESLNVCASAPMLVTVMATTQNLPFALSMLKSEPTSSRPHSIDLTSNSNLPSRTASPLAIDSPGPSLFSLLLA